MDLQSKIGQLFFIGITGTEGSPALRKLLREVRPGGVVLFSRNIEDPAQTRRLCAFLSAAVDPPPFLAIDQEGGRVNRLEGLVGSLPTAVSFATPDGEARVAEYARQTARMLRALGFNMNFAPVVDLCAPDAANGIGDRSFGTNPKDTIRLAGAYIDALHAEGVASVVKHFPGLGPTGADTHESMPSCPKSEEELWEQDMLPFRSLAERSGAVMVGHAHYSAIDSDRRVSATMSTAVVGGLLRKRMAFSGLAITDDLEMGAVSQEATPDELALFSLLMGSDMVMFCKSQTRILNARRGLVRAIHAARLSKELIDASVGRIVAAKSRFAISKVDEVLPEAELVSARSALAAGGPGAPGEGSATA